MLSTTLLSLLLCLKMGRVFFIMGKILGLCGLYVDTKAKVFLSCVFAFTFLSSPCGMSLALLKVLVIRSGGYSLLRRMLLRWFILLVCFLFVTSTNYGSNSSRKIKWYINFGVTWVSRFEVDIIEGVCCFVKDICCNFAIDILYDSYIQEIDFFL